MKADFGSFGKMAALAFLSILCGCSTLKTGATAKGIVYGPDPNRKIDESKVTYYVSPDGDDSKDGKTRPAALKTMQKAVDLVNPGETVLVLKGLYKEGFWINKHGRKDAWINIIAEPGAEIRGSDIVKTWKKESGFKHPVYSIPRPKLNSNYQKADADISTRTEQVFVNGKLLNQVIDKGMLKPKDVFYVEDEAKILYVCLKDGKDPNIEATEVSYRTWAISIGANNQHNWDDMTSYKRNQASYIRVDGFTIRNIACFARWSGINICGTCSNITIENCDIQWLSSYGIMIGTVNSFYKEINKRMETISEGHIIRNNILSNCGMGGGAGGGASCMIVEKNIMDNNNYKGVSPWNEGGPFKYCSGCTNVIIRHNIARNNNNHGLWFDYGGIGCVIENNFVYKSISGGILNEVTPWPGRIYGEDGKVIWKQYTLDELKKYKGPGTTIRNNVVVGTMAPLGGGINLSSSCNVKVYNNVVAYCAGSALNVEGGPRRPDIIGNCNNMVYANIAYDNYACASVSTDKSGRIFNNVFKDNLFLNWRAEKPVSLGNAWADEATFEIYNQGAKNYYFKDKNIFRSPETFDFTITEPALAAKIGFVPENMRLDWSEFYVETRKVSTTPDSNLQFAPIDINSVLNRSLRDDVAGDGKGGWTDQGLNDMSRLPVGKQIFSGIPFNIGAKDRGALFLKNNRMKEGATFTEEAKIPVGLKCQKLYFMYGAAWCGDQKEVDGKMVKIENAERAKFIVKYRDGTQVDIPVNYRSHILDWWEDPTTTWQTCATLNDNGVYVAWQGPNRNQGLVTTYYLRWNNPDPEKEIESVIVNNSKANQDCAFFFLALTGANAAGKGEKSDKVFTMDFDGNVDTMDAYGREIEVQGVEKTAFKAAKFVEGVKEKGIVPVSPLYYDMPEEFPFDSGTLSLWLKADDFLAAGRIAEIKKADYLSVMGPLTVTFKGIGEKEPTPRNITWSLIFRIDTEGKSLTVESDFGTVFVKEVISSIIKPGEWFNVVLKWDKSKDGRTSMQKVFINGKCIADKSGTYHGAKEIKRGKVIVGVTANGAQRWYGVMDELTVWNRLLSDEEIAKVARVN